MIETSLFPYENFGVRLEQKNENRICWFKDKVDLQKHLDRYKLDKRTLKIDYRDEEPVQSSKTNKAKVRQGTTKDSNRSSDTSKKRTKKLDKPGNTTRTRKPKK